VTDRRTSDLNVLGVEGVGGHPLQRLVPYLATQLPEEAMPTVSEAVASWTTPARCGPAFNMLAYNPER